MSTNRHKARASAIEVIYAWSCSEQDNSMLASLIDGRIADEERGDQDQEYLRAIVEGITSKHEALDTLLRTAVKGRSMNSIGQIERNVLRLAIWEMSERLEIPYRVIINEALELTRDYADESARGFVNGVLDKMAKELRAKELGG